MEGLQDIGSQRIGHDWVTMLEHVRHLIIVCQFSFTSKYFWWHELCFCLLCVCSCCFNFYFILEHSWLTMLWWFQVCPKATQPFSHALFRNILFSFHVFGVFPYIFVIDSNSVLTRQLNLLRFEYFETYWDLFCDQSMVSLRCSVCTREGCGFCCWMEYCMSVRSSCLMVLFSISLLIFCLLVISTIERWVLKSPSIIMHFILSHFSVWSGFDLCVLMFW